MEICMDIQFVIGHLFFLSLLIIRIEVIILLLITVQ